MAANLFALRFGCAHARREPVDREETRPTTRTAAWLPSHSVLSSPAPMVLNTIMYSVAQTAIRPLVWYFFTTIFDWFTGVFWWVFTTTAYVGGAIATGVFAIATLGRWRRVARSRLPVGLTTPIYTNDDARYEHVAEEDDDEEEEEEEEEASRNAMPHKPRRIRRACHAADYCQLTAIVVIALGLSASVLLTYFHYGYLYEDAERETKENMQMHAECTNNKKFSHLPAAHKVCTDAELFMHVEYPKGSQRRALHKLEEELMAFFEWLMVTSRHLVWATLLVLVLSAVAPTLWRLTAPYRSDAQCYIDTRLRRRALAKERALGSALYAPRAPRNAT